METGTGSGPLPSTRHSQRITASSSGNHNLPYHFNYSCSIVIDISTGTASAMDSGRSATEHHNIMHCQCH